MLLLFSSFKRNMSDFWPFCEAYTYPFNFSGLGKNLKFANYELSSENKFLPSQFFWEMEGMGCLDIMH